MVKLDPERFLGELGQLYSANRKENRRAVWLTIKRTFPKLEGIRGAKRKAALRSDTEKTDVVACLIRATNGKKKIATEVDAETVSQFSGALMNVVRLNADDVRERRPAAARRRPGATAGDNNGSDADAKARKNPRESRQSSSSTQESTQHLQQKPKKQQQKVAATTAQQQRRGPPKRQYDRGEKREAAGEAERGERR